MTRYLMWIFLVYLTSINSYATTVQTEGQLLASWGVVEQKMGIIKYQNKPLNALSSWVNKPLTGLNQLDYSVIPVRFKPFIIYNN